MHAPLIEEPYTMVFSIQVGMATGRIRGMSLTPPGLRKTRPKLDLARESSIVGKPDPTRKTTVVCGGSKRQGGNNGRH